MKARKFFLRVFKPLRLWWINVAIEASELEAERALAMRNDATRLHEFERFNQVRLAARRQQIERS